MLKISKTSKLSPMFIQIHLKNRIITNNRVFDLQKLTIFSAKSKMVFKEITQKY